VLSLTEVNVKIRSNIPNVNLDDNSNNALAALIKLEADDLPEVALLAIVAAACDSRDKCKVVNLGPPILCEVVCGIILKADGHLGVGSIVIGGGTGNAGDVGGVVEDDGVEGEVHDDVTELSWLTDC
jgi:hypothetical protein